MRVSYTKLDLFKLCRRKYKFYVDKAPQDPSRTAAMRFGRAVHQALEFAYHRRYRKPGIEQVLGYYDNVCAALLFEDDPTEVRDLFLQKGRDALVRYLEQHSPRDIRVVEVEKKFVLPLDEKHEIQGVVDRVDMLPDGSFDIIDYKTGAIPDAEKLGENWQLAIYQFAKQRMLQTKRLTSSLVYIMYDGHKLSYQFNKQELEYIRERILRLIHVIEQEQDFPPRVGSWCDTCPYQPICPAWEHKFLYRKEKETVPELAHAQEAIDRLVALVATIRRLSSEADQLKEIVAHFARERKLTRLFSDRGTVTVSSRASARYDSARVIALLPDDILRKVAKGVDAKTLHELLPDMPQELREKIEGLRASREQDSVIVRPFAERDKGITP